MSRGRAASTIDASSCRAPSPVTVVSQATYDASQPVRLSSHVYRAGRLRLRHESGATPVTWSRPRLTAGLRGQWPLSQRPAGLVEQDAFSFLIHGPG